MKAGTRISDFGYDSRRDFGIDVLKAVSAMMVVVIHCWLELYVAYPHYWYLAPVVARLGVGCFFMITGYYLPRLTADGKLGRHLRKLVRLALGSSLLILALNMAYYQIFNNDYTIPLVNAISDGGIMRFLSLNDFKGEIHVWFLFATLYAVAIWTLLCRINALRWFYVIAAAGFVTGLFAVYRSPDPAMARNWFCYALPYVAAGAAMRSAPARKALEHTRDWALWLTMALSIAAVVAEAVIYMAIHDFYFASIVGAAAALALASRTVLGADSPVWRPLAVIGMKYSAYIYIFHVSVKSVIDSALRFVGVMPDALTMPLYIVAIYGASLVVAIVWTRWKRRPF